MKKFIVPLMSVLLLSACGDGGNNSQSDPVDNTPASGATSAPADQDPTPQTGTGGQSPVESPAGTEKR
ncbi:hypothetical protein REJC140_00759 [Pseudorhizobium endolithicum]|uniref:Lipoprotein n=1 Tax=Pseudorhizobium endolithicum TaxID=1191678 RepID=A0ABN7JSS5_9HYPH|nr:hypothetical protein [Pseudorhizobium endolithicum]CAD6407006.1 hypothetical protein REQ54_00216 [Rhizobium sp. Q54]CAD7039502.1 hypothetical protein REJC140_00759 [Pseudorhizobium endolithicum]